MKKILITFCMLLMTAGIMTAQTAEEANASKIIDMTNGTIEMYNKYLSNMKKVREGLEKSAENIEVLKENINRGAHGFNCSYFGISDVEVSVFQKTVKAAPAFPEKAKIQEAVEFVIANNDEFGKRCSALTDYFNKKQYVDDAGFAKYEELFSSLNDMYSKMSDTWKTATNLASDAGDRSEVILLKKSPIAEFIIPMKEDLARVKKCVDKLYQDDVDVNALKTDIAAIEKAGQKNRSLEGKKVENLKKYSYPSFHTSFYDYVEEFVKQSTRIQELLSYDKDTQVRMKDEINNTYYAVGRAFEGMIKSYNEM